MLVTSLNDVQPNWAQEYGTVPLIIQEYREDRSGKVLMLVRTNKEAYELTWETGTAYFWSLPRQTVWGKGEAACNPMQIKEIWLDYKKSTLLYLVTSKSEEYLVKRWDCFSEVFGQE